LKALNLNKNSNDWFTLWPFIIGNEIRNQHTSKCSIAV
jgi:hypothetical protein